MALIRETKEARDQFYVIIENYYHKELSGKDKVRVTLYQNYSDAKKDFDSIVAQLSKELGNPKPDVYLEEYYYCDTNNERASVQLTRKYIY